MKATVLLIVLLTCRSLATSVTDVAARVANAGQEVVAYLPNLQDGTVAKALGAAARRGVQVWVFTTPQAVQDATSWSLSVAHAPGVLTYFVPAGGVPFVATDASWGATGLALDQEGPGLGAPSEVQGQALSPFLAWAGQVTRLGKPVSPVDLVRLRYHLP